MNAGEFHAHESYRAALEEDCTANRMVQLALRMAQVSHERLRAAEAVLERARREQEAEHAVL